MRKKVVLISAAVAIVAGISAATAVTAGTAARAGGDVTIGTSLPLTGSLAPFGPTLRMGFQRAAPAGEPGRGPHPSPSWVAGHPA